MIVLRCAWARTAVASAVILATVTGCPVCQTDADCNDNDRCTRDECLGGACVNHPDCTANNQCNDGDPTTTDLCLNGCCANITDEPCADIDRCDDNDPCTVDWCDFVTGDCINEPVVCDSGLGCDPNTGSCPPPPGDLTVWLPPSENLGTVDQQDGGLLGVGVVVRCEVLSSSYDEFSLSYSWSLASGPSGGWETVQSPPLGHDGPGPPESYAELGVERNAQGLFVAGTYRWECGVRAPDGQTAEAFTSLTLSVVAGVCTIDGDCDNGDFCDGVEACDLATGSCVDGTPPCDLNEVCYEDTDSCEGEPPEPCYTPGVPVERRVEVTPPSGTFAYAPEDSPPEGWDTSNVSDSGEFDASTGKVKWLFFDDMPRVLSYTATPPIGATGAACFEGTVDFNGETVEPMQDYCIGHCEE